MEPTIPDEPDAQSSRELVAAGTELAGAVAGAALGLVGGPAGSVVGAAAGVVVTHGLRRAAGELLQRHLGHRQLIRVGGAFTFAAAEISERLEAGDLPRDDGFFAETEWDAADELLEGVLLAAADSFEEKKVRYLGTMYASFVFDSSIAAPDASFLIRVAREMTYRQMCVIALFGSPPDGVIKRIDADQQRQLDDALLIELDNLGQEGILGFRQDTGALARPSTTLGGGDFRGVALANVGLTSLGETLHRLMRLDRVPLNDVLLVAAGLGATPSTF